MAIKILNEPPSLGGGGAVQADRGPLGWAPVLLHLPASAFEFADGTGGQETYGQYTAMTKDGLVLVERAGRHVGTLNQSRWGWLAATYAAEVMCEALPSWIAGVDLEEHSRGGPQPSSGPRFRVYLRWIAFLDATHSLLCLCNTVHIQNLGYTGRVGQVTWDLLR